MSDKVNIYEKFGDFLLNLIQLIVGGIIFAAIMADNTINPIILYLSALFAVIFLLFIAFVLFKLSNKK
jgi:Na+/H+ antiporter NhaC